MSRSTTWAIAGLLLAFFVFTSGLIFELSGTKTMSTIDTPYSLALSGDRTGVLGIYDDNDIACAQWVASTTKDTLIFGDYNAISLIMEYSPDYMRFVNYYEPKEAHFVFLLTWNVRHQEMVVGSSSALRDYKPMPDISKAVEVYRKGEAVVYYKQADK